MGLLFQVKLAESLGFLRHLYLPSRSKASKLFRERNEQDKTQTMAKLCGVQVWLFVALIQLVSFPKETLQSSTPGFSKLLFVCVCVFLCYFFYVILSWEFLLPKTNHVCTEVLSNSYIYHALT